MADVVLSTNMNLPIPVVSLAPGPEWASSLNSCLQLIDVHNHSSGGGVQITPDGLDINSDLGFQSNNAIALRTTRFAPQTAVLSAPTDIGCLYEVTNDLYYNDGVGNQVRLTQSGAVAGTPGSIANLVSPASASYVSLNQTFVWQSAANTPANLDAGSVIFRNITANSFGVTVSAPASLGANYALVLPTLPVAASVLSVDASGNIGTGVAGTVRTVDLAAGSVTPVKKSALGQQTSTDSGASAGTTSSSFVVVTNQTVTITTTGRPVCLILSGVVDAGNAATWGALSSSLVTFAFFRDSTQVNQGNFQTNAAAAQIVAPNMIAIDVPAAGTYTYTLKQKAVGGTSVCSHVQITAYEM